MQAPRRAALWGMLAAKLWGGWGVTWDIQWHLLIGRDSFWIPPHLMTYSGVAVVAALALTTLAQTRTAQAKNRVRALKAQLAAMKWEER